MFISVPIDNLSHMLFWGFWKEDAPHDPEDEQMLTSGERDLDNYATFDGGPDNAWGQDRQAMAGGHFTGFDGCLLQEDVVVQASMGRIADRTKEQLCASDLAVSRLRRRLLEQVRAFEEKREVPATPDVVRPVDIVSDEHYRWRERSEEHTSE